METVNTLAKEKKLDWRYYEYKFTWEKRIKQEEIKEKFL